MGENCTSLGGNKGKNVTDLGRKQLEITVLTESEEREEKKVQKGMGRLKEKSENENRNLSN